MKKVLSDSTKRQRYDLYGKKGLLDAKFAFDDSFSFYTNYYLVRKQENN